MLASSGLPVSEKLGALPPWSWLLDLSPGWAFCVMLFISPVAIKFVIRPLCEGRLVPRRYEFMSFQLDVCFAPALASGLVLVGSLEDRVYLRSDNVAHWVIVVGALLVGAVHFYEERREYSLRALFTLSKIYHELLFTFIGYWVFLVGFYGIFFAPWTYEMIVMRVVMVGSLAIWAPSWPLYDNPRRSNPVDAAGHTRYYYAHVEDGWPWQHKYRHLRQSLGMYIADWRQTPARATALWRRIVA